MSIKLIRSETPVELQRSSLCDPLVSTVVLRGSPSVLRDFLSRDRFHTSRHLSGDDPTPCHLKRCLRPSRLRWIGIQFSEGASTAAKQRMSKVAGAPSRPDREHVCDLAFGVLAHRKPTVNLRRATGLMGGRILVALRSVS